MISKVHNTPQIKSSAPSLAINNETGNDNYSNDDKGNSNEKAVFKEPAVGMRRKHSEAGFLKLAQHQTKRKKVVGAENAEGADLKRTKSSVDVLLT